jgi:hypothetical protein
MIDTVCMGSCKSNYHTFMATTAPEYFEYWSMNIRYVH